ncbi:ASCH domain-containing protein [Nitriliruptor alkaliphilus]|uniref:ASCH domain-containing protein n=1 Tax=Nitriliruptor alkaliphilus TaxID=427918 RepID=UPI001B80D2F4|nr:ASCH domain-containing protein [Nitriliruptor alkaliphilus]
MTADREQIDDLERRSGRSLAGAFAFGDSTELADELLAFVERGTKRATAGSVAELLGSQEPFPEPGQCWGLLDGRGVGRYVMETSEVRIGRLASVDPAFAWDEGEYERTYEDWLEGHRRYFARQGVAEPDELEVAFERFRVVWPVADTTVWLADGVREVGIEDRPWATRFLGDRHGPGMPDDPEHPTRLPALVAERDGEPAGLLTFRPRPGGITDVVTIDEVAPSGDVRPVLEAGLARLAEQEGWMSLQPPSER